MAFKPFIVINSGSPGPAPTKYTFATVSLPSIIPFYFELFFMCEIQVLNEPLQRIQHELQSPQNALLLYVPSHNGKGLVVKNLKFPFLLYFPCKVYLSDSR